MSFLMYPMYERVRRIRLTPRPLVYLCDSRRYFLQLSSLLHNTTPVGYSELNCWSDSRLHSECLVGRVRVSGLLGGPSSEEDSFAQFP